MSRSVIAVLNSSYIRIYSQINDSLLNKEGTRRKQACCFTRLFKGKWESQRNVWKHLYDEWSHYICVIAEFITSFHVMYYTPAGYSSIVHGNSLFVCNIMQIFEICILNCFLVWYLQWNSSLCGYNCCITHASGNGYILLNKKTAIELWGYKL